MEQRPTADIKLRISFIEGGSKTRTFKTLDGARKFAHNHVGETPTIGTIFGYAVDDFGACKIEVVSGTTLALLFPKCAGDL